MSGLPGYPGGVPLRPSGLPSLPPGTFPPVPPHLAPRPIPPFLNPGQGPMLVPPVGLIPPPGLPPMCLGGIPKSTSVYVGKIPNTAEDSIIQTLLEACGEVKSWKRAEDPETHQPKGFGFCEFEEAEGVLRAIRLLNNLTIDGQELLVKSNTATAKYIEAYQKDFPRLPPAEQEEGEAVESVEQKDNKVLEKIMGILTDRENQKKGDDGLVRGDQNSETSLPSKKGDTESRKKRREQSVDSRAERDLSRERREMETRRRDEESAYRKRMYDWDRYETRLGRELRREEERIRELRKDREWNLHADNEFEESDDERELWNRKPYKETRRAKNRRKAKLEEEAWEQEDRVKEIAELEKPKEEEEEEPKKESSEDMEIDVELMEVDQMIVPKPPQDDDEDKGVSNTTNELLLSGETAQEAEVAAGSSSIALTLANKKQNKSSATGGPSSNEALKDVFGDEEEDKPKREMKLLNFSDDEERTVISQDTKISAKELIDALPKTKDEIYNYEVKWDAYSAEELGPKIQTWVSKKISEILGFEEESLSSFIMNQLNQHQPPSELEQELFEVLEDKKETEVFIIKLYRTVIFETEKAALGH
eukprot:g4293.t1